MHEPKRLNLYQIIQKNLEIANRRNFLHRVVYFFPTENNSPDFWLNSLKNMIKILNEGNFENPLVGLGIVYPGYVINTIEGTEDLIKRHFAQLKTIVKKDDLKILLFLPHIDKIFFAIWRGMVPNPPTRSQPLKSENNPESHGSLVKQCVLQLYKLFEILNVQSEPDAKIYSQHLPDTQTLDILQTSPLLLSGNDMIEGYESPPDYSIYHQMIWPAPPDFVPKNILPDL